MASASQLPALTFDPSKVGDLGSMPVVYMYDDKNQQLVELGSDKNGEIAAMIQAVSRDTAVDVTINPLYIAPSRERFALTYGADHGTAKEYAVASVSFAQTKAMPVLNGKRLSWSATYTLVNGTQDVPDSQLSSPSGDDTFQLMHLVDGAGQIGINFTTGVAGGSGLSRWLAGAQTITGDADGSKILKFAGATLEAANSAFAAIGGILSSLGTPRFDVEIASTNALRIAAHSKVPALLGTGIIRIPQAPTKFLFTPSRYQDGFRAALAQLVANKQKLTLDPDDAEPIVVDANGTPIQSANPNLLRGPLAPFTIVVIEMSADLAVSNGGSPS
jgi:hypothetical protein